MRKTKRIYADYAFFDRTGIQKFLEKQARKGWMLKSVKGSTWHFERIDPQNIHFSVAYFPQAEDQNQESANKKKYFVELCEYSGWKYLCRKGTMLIFCNESYDPLPIETDAAVELETIHKAAKKEFLAGRWPNVIIGFLFLALDAFKFFYLSVETLADYGEMLEPVYGLSLILFYGFDMLRYYVWRRKALKAAALDGSFVETRSYPWANRFFTVMMFVVFFARGAEISWAMIMVGVVLVLFALLLKWILDYEPEEKRNPVKNGILLGIRLTALAGVGVIACAGPIVMIYFAPETLDESVAVSTYEVDGKIYEVYADEIPLTIEDLMWVDYDGYSYERIEVSETFLLGNYEARQEPRVDDPELPELRYRIVTVKAPWLYDWCVDSLLGDSGTYSVSPAVPWEAETAYQRYEESSKIPFRWLLCFEDRIVELRLEWEPTPEQMALIGETLGGK